MDKRSFLKQSIAASLGSILSFPVLSQVLSENSHLSSESFASKDDIWLKMNSAYKLSTDYINLENGYYCILPEEILESFITLTRRINFEGSHYMRTKFNDDKLKVREHLAGLIDCDVNELLITRNTTESLDLVIGGYPWQQGDEAVMAEQDYGAMLNMFELQSEKHGVINHRVSLPNNPTSDSEIVELYANAITSRTKLLMICQIVNITGHILPVRKICDMAHAKGVEVMVDGAHGFGHLQTSFKDFDCDYYGSSLHKWFNAPLGNGILIIKKDRIAQLWPLMAESRKSQDDILRLGHTGTTPPHVMLGILAASEFNRKLGLERKQERLKFLNTYWTKQVRGVKNIYLNTPEQIERYGAIANVGIKGLSAKELASELMDRFKIWTVGINRPNVQGIRVTPNIFTTTKDLDALVGALKQIANEQ